MHNEFIKINDKILIEDSEGNKKMYSYDENTEKALEKENLIEALKEEMRKNNESIDDINDTIEKCKSNIKIADVLKKILIVLDVSAFAFIPYIFSKLNISILLMYFPYVLSCGLTTMCDLTELKRYKNRLNFNIKCNNYGSVRQH